MSEPGPAATVVDTKHVDVLVVGAGDLRYRGGLPLEATVPGRSFLLLDALESDGGTWWIDRYPGARPDSDLFTFGYGFKPGRGPSIATAQETVSYLDEVIERGQAAAAMDGPG